MRTFRDIDGHRKTAGIIRSRQLCGYEFIGDAELLRGFLRLLERGRGVAQHETAAAAVERIDHNAVALIGDESDLLDLVLFTADDVHLDAVGLDALHGDLVGLIVGGGAAVHRASLRSSWAMRPQFVGLPTA